MCSIDLAQGEHMRTKTLFVPAWQVMPQEFPHLKGNVTKLAGIDRYKTKPFTLLWPWKSGRCTCRLAWPAPFGVQSLAASGNVSPAPAKSLELSPPHPHLLYDTLSFTNISLIPRSLIIYPTLCPYHMIQWATNITHHGTHLIHPLLLRYQLISYVFKQQTV